MTPAVTLLKKHHIAFQLHHYHHNPDDTHYGEEAITKLNVPANTVYKTLLVTLSTHNRQIITCVIPVIYQLDLKKVAQYFNAKKAELTSPQQAEKLTGYLVGGISPLGQKKLLPTLIDLHAQQQQTILISGGKRGLDISISPADLATLLNASFTDLISI